MRFTGKSLTATIAIVAILSSQAFVAFADTPKTTKKRQLTEEQRIIHVLNRLGFGARPGYVARVKSMGLDNYINPQNNP
jgi:hypothetical protein